MVKKQIKNENGTVAYWISDAFDPNRDTIFFLHGLTANHTLFDANIPYFAPDYNIITWDAPSHGESRPYRPFTFENATSEMMTILNECEVAQTILIGQSMGGFISQAFICRHPERVKSFIAIDSCPYGDYYSKSDKWWLRQIEWMSKLYTLSALKSAIAKQNAATEKSRENMAAMVADYDKSELCHLMGVVYAEFLRDNRPLDIRCPVLLIVGENDHTGKVRQYNKEWTKRTNYPLIWIADAAHNSNADNPNDVNKAISEFLASL